MFFGQLSGVCFWYIIVIDLSKRKGFQVINWTVQNTQEDPADHSTAMTLYEQLLAAKAVLHRLSGREMLVPSARDCLVLGSVYVSHVT